MEQMKFCQSCGMPLGQESDLGTEKNGEKNREYCVYCYQNGAFTQDCTMEEMVDACVGFAKEAAQEGQPALTKEAMMQWFPTLKRWRKEA